MLPGANILDQLLGGFEIKPTGSAGGGGATGVSAEGEVPGLLFGDLLTQSMAEGAPGEQVISNLLFPSNDQPAAQDEAPAGPTVERGSLIELVASAPTAPADADKPIGLRSVPPAMPAANPADGEKSLEFPVAYPTDPKGLPHLETELKSGVFRILDSKIVDGRLELTAAAEDSPEQPVRISLPESMVKESVLKLSNVNSGARASRVAVAPLDGVPSTQTGRLDELLARLNLKTLEIKVAPDVASRKPAMNPVEVTLVAGQSGTEIAVKSKIGRSTIQIRSDRKGADDSARPASPKIPGGCETKPSIATRSAALDVGADNLRRDAGLTRFTLPERFGGNPATTLNDNVSMQPTFENTLEPLTTGVERKMAPTVKLTLPDMIQKPFSAGGQTVMIKIEPEQLGPARLTLAMRDQVLTARVVVDTPIARMAVLNSLDQLTDQLSRAGIDVDRIDVTLSGDSAREQFLDRRSGWTHAQKTRRFDDELENGLESRAGTPNLTVPPLEYIGADRVNVLA